MYPQIQAYVEREIAVNIICTFTKKIIKKFLMGACGLTPTGFFFTYAERLSGE
jgi:hypothetical protein